MNIVITSSLEDVEWVALAELYDLVSLGARDPQQLRRAFERSYRVALAWRDGRIIGAGRVLSDGEFYAAVYDVAVLPEFQRQGIGARLMEALLEDLPPGPVLLFAVPGKERFYERFGFRRMRTAMARFRRPERAREQGFVE